MPDDLMDKRAVAKYLSGASIRTGHRFMNEGHIPVYLIRGKRYVKRSELELWVEAQKVEPPTLKDLVRNAMERARARRKKAKQ